MYLELNLEKKQSIGILQQTKINQGIVYISMIFYMASASPVMKPSITMSSPYLPPCWFRHPRLYSSNRARSSAPGTWNKFVSQLHSQTSNVLHGLNGFAKILNFEQKQENFSLKRAGR
jgi:hypothetical protein